MEGENVFEREGDGEKKRGLQAQVDETAKGLAGEEQAKKMLVMARQGINPLTAA